MQEPMDVEEVESSSKPQHDDITRRTQKTKTGCKRPYTFSGSKKGFLNLEAKKKCTDSERNASDVQVIDRNTNPDRDTDTRNVEGHRKNETKDKDQESGDRNTEQVDGISIEDLHNCNPSTSTESLSTTTETSHVDGAVSKSDPGDVYRQQWKFSDYEYQLLYEGDLVKECAFNWQKCTKDPGHVGFIPLPEFSIQHLPQRFQSEDILNLIKAVADLTFRLRVTFSPNRPRDGKTSTSRGFTGSAYVYTVKPRDKDCPCADCKTHGYKNKKWWDICLYTAAHCINDTFEANNVKIDFFYDSKESQKKGDVKTLYGVREHRRAEDGDGCVALLATHDDELGRRLRQAYDQYISILKRFQSKPSTPSAVSEKKVMVMVSHPHGQPKMVTVGECRSQYDVTYDDTELYLLAKHFASLKHGVESKEYWVEYTTKSCSGSSGSRLLCLDDVTSGDIGRQVCRLCTHCRANLSTGCNVGSFRTFNKLEHHPSH